MKLYELTNDLSEILNLDTEEIDEKQKQEIISTINALIEQKSGNIIKYVKNIEYDIENCKAEEKRLKEHRTKLEKRLDNFKDYVRCCLTNADIKRVDTPIGKITLRKSPRSVEILDENAIPEEFIKIETVKKIDKVAIKEKLQMNENIEGVKLAEEKYNISIK